MDVQYIGRAHKRTIRDTDAQAAGVEGFKTTTWVGQKPASISAAAGKWLTESYPGEFRKAPTSAKSSAASGAASSTLPQEG